jgi:putative tryptophan/tyrosine transport system substrate-binding protein
MKRSLMFLLMVVVVAARGIIAEAQQPKKVPRIGYLSSTSYSSNTEAFRQGLRDLGYTEGRNIVIEYRYAEGMSERLSDLAAELVRLKVDVFVAAGGTPVALAAKRATVTIPIVMTNSGDPVATGLVASLARPGGNITGLSLLAPDTAGKRLELIKEVIPALSRVAVLWNPANPSTALQLKATQAAAREIGVQVQSLEARGPDDFENAFRAARGVGAILALGDPVYTLHQTRIIDLAVRNRLPTMYIYREFVQAGGLMSYGPSLSDNFRRAAVYVDKVLKGTKPADLPIEQPTKFEFAVNLKTAKALNLTIPQSVLFRADKVIK